MEIEHDAIEGVEQRTLTEATEVLTRGGRKFEKLSKAGIDRLFTPSIDRNEMFALISQKLRKPDLPVRSFEVLVNYYMELKRWHLFAPRGRATRGKKKAEHEADTALHELVAEIEKRGDSN